MVDRMLGNAGKDMAQVCLRIEIVEHCDAELRVDRRSAPTASVGARKQMDLPSQGDWAERAYGCVVVELDASVVRETAERAPLSECVMGAVGKVITAASCSRSRSAPASRSISSYPSLSAALASREPIALARLPLNAPLKLFSRVGGRFDAMSDPGLPIRTQGVH